LGGGKGEVDGLVRPEVVGNKLYGVLRIGVIPCRRTKIKKKSILKPIKI
jgi:hypothetical protein